MSDSDLSQIEAFVKDLGERVASAAATAGAGTAAVLWSASGLHVRDLLTVSGWDKAWSIVGVGVLASVFQASITTVRAYFKARNGRIAAEIEAEEKVAPEVKA